MAFLLAGTFRDVSGSGLPPVGGVILPGYGEQIIGGADHPPITADSSVGNVLAGRLSALGVQSPSVSLLSPGGGPGVAAMVVGQVGDPASFMAEHGSPWMDVFGDLNAYEGTYLELDNPQGQPFVIASYASRAAHGSSWLAPGLSKTTVTSAPVHPSTQ